MPSKLLQNRKAWGYDLECFQNIFSAYFINIVTGEEKLFVISSINGQNDLGALLTFIHSDSVEYLIGYNSITYDDKLISYLYQYRRELARMPLEDFNYCLFNISYYVINKPGTIKIYRWNAYKSVDIFRTFGFRRANVGLKRCAVVLRAIQIQDLPYDWDKPIPDEGLNPVLYYNRIDVINTIDTLKAKDNDLILRDFLAEKYGEYLYNSDNTYLAKIIFINKFNEKVPDKYQINMSDLRKWRTNRKTIPLKEVLDPNITFDTPEFQKIKEDLENITIHLVGGKFRVWDEANGKFKKMKYQTEIDGVPFTVACGGIHDCKKNWRATSDALKSIIELDFSSYYPYLMCFLKIVPEHFKPVLEQFIETIKELIDDRMHFKYHPDKSAFTDMSADSLKIAINSLFGLLGSKFFAFYDPMCVLRVTMNGQLGIMKTWEECRKHGIQALSLNTDGIVLEVPNDQLHVMDEVCAIMPKYVGGELEAVKYAKMIQSHVNSYIWVSEKGKIKRKGEFLPLAERGFEKDHSQGVVIDALNNFLLNDIPIRDTVMNCTDIFDFTISKRMGTEKKSGNTFTLYTTTDDDLPLEAQQKTTRFYCSSDGHYLKKYGSFSQEALIKNQRCTIYNTHVEKPLLEYNIDYSYYISAAENIVGQFNIN